MEHLQTPAMEDMEVRQLTVPPHSVEAEQSVLGGLLIDGEAWEKIEDILAENDFYRHEHRLIFHAIHTLASASRAVDILTVQDVLLSNNTLEEVGGFDYLYTLAQNIPSAANIKRYAEIVHERAIIRQLAEVGTEIARNAYNPQGKTAEELLDIAENSVFQIAESTEKSKQNFLEMPELLAENIAKIDMLYQQGSTSEITGTATGFVDLDKKTSGLQPGDLVIVAGRPSMGKTAFAINIAENIALYEKLPVAIFSMEMGASQLTLRMLSSVGRVEQSLLRNGQLNREEWARLNEAVTHLNAAPIFIDETSALTALEVRARARRLAKQHGGKLGAIVIDYLQMMSGSGKRNSNRVEELGEISRSLKSLAKELQVPVIALSQLSRSVESRPNKRPMMSDLRESGAIEQDADLIMFMYRDEYYNKEKSELKGLAECIIGKHRNGPTGTVYLTFLGQFTRFETAAYVPEYANTSE